MKYLVAAAALTVVLGGGVAHAQTALDHNVQRTWDNLFNPPPPGDPRTNWERRRDADVAAQHRAAEHAEWCRYHRGADSCGRYYSRY